MGGGSLRSSDQFPPGYPGQQTKYAPLSAYSSVIDGSSGGGGFVGPVQDIERGRDFNPEFERESLKYTGKGSLRFLYGYDLSSRNFLGTDRLVEKHRAESLNRVIESSIYFESDLYAPYYTKSLQLNNLCYKTIYQYFFAILSLTFGVLLSVCLAVATAFVEFSVQFIVRPLLKMARMIVEIFILGMHMVADVIRPIASLWLPWNKN